MAFGSFGSGILEEFSIKHYFYNQIQNQKSHSVKINNSISLQNSSGDPKMLMLHQSI